ncbi:hypothetical protein HCJ93_24960 [Streptomyces sp. SBST2-5]|mgnify:CR=1 FL=1|uniref:Uncharacterized protein n=1 Tax=Streptomyces composti TaxID=2720025 RepID=A0ABX1AEV9_9ACTN|nr:hypothetical protein [Streptomyces composti]NJP53229.1 hypothetical protein [Streptomyces composti]
MTDVVDSDELLRRIQRARAFAARAEREWRARGEEAARTDPRAAGEAESRRVAYEVVVEVLDEIVRPGRHPVRG